MRGMHMEQMELKDILSLQRQIKKNAKVFSGKVYSNIYHFFVPEMEHIKCDYRMTESALSFAYFDEKGVYRVFFASFDLTELKGELSHFPKGSVLDYVCEGENELRDAFLGGNFREIATYTRKSINLVKEGKDFKRSHSELLEPYYNPNIGEYATEDDAEEIVQILDEVFDREMDHLPAVEKVKEYAGKKWILIYRDKGKISALYLFQIQGKKFYSNISYNSLPAVVLYCLEKRAHMEVIENYDVILKYSWINTKNAKSLKRNILNYDNVFTYIYKKV